MRNFLEMSQVRIVVRTGTLGRINLVSFRGRHVASPSMPTGVSLFDVDFKMAVGPKKCSVRRVLLEVRRCVRSICEV